MSGEDFDACVDLVLSLGLLVALVWLLVLLLTNPAAGVTPQ